MTRILVLIPLIGLLTACQSKKEICARWNADVISTKEAVQKLGVEGSKLLVFCSWYD